MPIDNRKMNEKRKELKKERKNLQGEWLLNSHLLPSQMLMLVRCSDPKIYVKIRKKLRIMKRKKYLFFVYIS